MPPTPCNPPGPEHQAAIDRALLDKLDGLFPDERTHLLTLLEGGSILDCHRLPTPPTPTGAQQDNEFRKAQDRALRGRSTYPPPAHDPWVCPHCHNRADTIFSCNHCGRPRPHA